MLEKFERIKLGHFPTPIEHLKNITKYLGGPNIFIKRDDCTGLATGGNKTRKLEFLIPDAIKNKAELVVTVGAVQSNHARQTAAACTLMGLKCLIIFEKLYLLFSFIISFIHSTYPRAPMGLDPPPGIK